MILNTRALSEQLFLSLKSGILFSRNEEWCTVYPSSHENTGPCPVWRISVDQGWEWYILRVPFLGLSLMLTSDYFNCCRYPDIRRHWLPHKLPSIIKRTWWQGIALSGSKVIFQWWHDFLQTPNIRILFAKEHEYESKREQCSSRSPFHDCSRNLLLLSGTLQMVIMIALSIKLDTIFLFLTRNIFRWGGQINNSRGPVHIKNGG